MLTANSVRLADGSGPGAASSVEDARADYFFRLGATVLADMRQHRVLPTPRHYELWFVHLSEANPELTRRIQTLLQSGQPLTSALMDRLYAEFLAGAETELDVIGMESDALQDVAQTLVDQVAGGQVALRHYGDALAQGAADLKQDRTHDGLVRAIMTLTSETARAAERNRELQNQLSASAARIDKLRKTLSEAKREATTDGLTGLSNRRAFDTRLRRILAEATGDSSDLKPLSLLLMDVDHFKRFNDLHGHRVGDLVLRLVARLLAENVKGRDMVARFGGEEFAVLLVGADLNAAASVARQIGGAISTKKLATRGGGQGYAYVTVSIGVAQMRIGESSGALIDRADRALYEAKRTGRNRVCVEGQQIVEH